MKRYFVLLIILILMIFACKETRRNESLYILYHGDRTLVLYDLILKNTQEKSNSNLMLIGKPLEYYIDAANFRLILQKLKPNYLYQEKEKGNKGIIVIHYIENEAKEKYFFKTGAETDYLNTVLLESISNLEIRNEIGDWFNVIKKIHNVQVPR